MCPSSAESLRRRRRSQPGLSAHGRFPHLFRADSVCVHRRSGHRHRHRCGLGRFVIIGRRLIVRFRDSCTPLRFRCPSLYGVVVSKIRNTDRRKTGESREARHSGRVSTPTTSSTKYRAGDECAPQSPLSSVGYFSVGAGSSEIGGLPSRSRRPSQFSPWQDPRPD